MLTLRDAAKGVYLSLRYGEPMPLWAIPYILSEAMGWPLSQTQKLSSAELCERIAVWYALRHADPNRREVDGIEEAAARACHAALMKSEEGEA